MDWKVNYGSWQCCILCCQLGMQYIPLTVPAPPVSQALITIKITLRPGGDSGLLWGLLWAPPGDLLWDLLVARGESALALTSTFPSSPHRSMTGIPPPVPVPPPPLPPVPTLPTVPPPPPGNIKFYFGLLNRDPRKEVTI